MLNHDDDIPWYEPYLNRDRKGAYDSRPGYCDPFAPDEPTGGDAKLLCRVFGKGDPALVGPELAPGLRLADFLWPDGIALVLGLIVLPVLYERCVCGTPLSEIGFQPGDRPYLLVNGGLAAGIGALFWAMLVCRVLRLQWPQLTNPTDPGSVGLFALPWSVVAFAEEVSLRGILQRRLTRAVGPTMAIAPVAAIFALASHGRAAPVMSLTIGLPLGFLSGHPYHRT